MELKIERLSKTYANGVHALRDVSLGIPRGMFGLLGPNGAGKSTLMRILATLQEPDSGSVRLGEVDVLREKDRVRGMLGYLPQEFGLYPKVEALPLLEHFALLKGVGERRERREVAEVLLRQTNLWDARHKKLGGFSGGMRQRFGIAIALIGSPRLIIVDEPTAGLDPAERVRFLNLLSEIGENAVVILSTHIVEDVSELCSRFAIINHGHILLEGEPLEAIERLRGRVWRRVIERAGLAAVEASHTVISTKLLSGRTVVRVVADAHPGDGFEPAEPDLEDVYFSVMHAIPLDAPPPPVESVEVSSVASLDGSADTTTSPPEPSAPSESTPAAPPSASAADVLPAAPTGAAHLPPVESAEPEAEAAHDVDQSERPPPAVSQVGVPVEQQGDDQLFDVVPSHAPVDVELAADAEPAPEIARVESVDSSPQPQPATEVHAAAELPASPSAATELEHAAEGVATPVEPASDAGPYVEGASHRRRSADDESESNRLTSEATPKRDDYEPQGGLLFDNATLPLFPGTPAEIVDPPRDDAADGGEPVEEPRAAEDSDQLGLFADFGPGEGAR